MTLKTDEIVGILRSELAQAQGFDQDELASNREKALDYFYNRPRGDEVAGRSTIQSSDVSDMVEAVLANIGPILTSETLINFQAAGEADEDQAQLESDFVGYIVGGQNAGYIELLSSIKDALLLRNGFIRVMVDETNDSRTFFEDNKTEFQIQAKLDESDTEHSFEVLDMKKTGDSFRVQYKEHIHKRDLIVESIAPENMLYSPDHDSPYLESCRFIAERKLMTQTELLQAGHSLEVIKDIPSIDFDTKNDSTARRQDDTHGNDPAVDESNRMIETWDIHTMLDEDEDGIAELRHIHLASKTILLDELADWIPYSTGSPFIIPHRLYGQSIYDKLRTIQDSKTHFLRQWHDNARRVNNARVVYNPLTTDEDAVMSSRAGGGIRSKDPASVQQLVTNDMGASILGALDYMDKMRSERGGASLDLGSAELQLAGQNIGQLGAERQISMKEQLAAMMTATLANTLVRETFLLVHRTLRAHLPGELTAKLNGKWVQTDPSQWPERKQVVVKTGLSQGEKIARISALTQVIQTQVGFIQAGQGGQTVSPGGVYNAILDWCRAANLENPEQYWLDPDSEQAQAAAKAEGEQQQAQQQAAQQFQQQQQRLQEQLFTLTQQLDKYKHDTDLRFQYDKEALDAEVEEAKIVGEATRDLELAQDKFENQSQIQSDAA